ncbi:hypothetical protein D3C72_1618230 [compost metagenome]
MVIPGAEIIAASTAELVIAWSRLMLSHFGLPSAMPELIMRTVSANDWVVCTPGVWRRRQASLSMLCRDWYRRQLSSLVFMMTTNWSLDSP